MHNVYHDMEHLKDILGKKIQQPFVERHLQRPFIDDNKLFIAYALFQHEPIAKKRDEYIASMMLIQIALDTHDYLPHLSEQPISEIEKQLSVLVGDYYSGLYYYILSNLEDISMIKLVAKSIKQINEYKMKIYYNNIHSFDDLLKTLAEIESVLFKYITRYYNLDIHESLIYKFLLANRLQREIQLIEQSKFSYVRLYARKELNYTKDCTIKNMLSKYYDDLVQEVAVELRQLPYHCTYVQEYMTKNLNMFYKTSLAEEG